MKTILMTVAVLALLVGTASAVDVVLTDGNSVARIDPTSQAGMYSWTVDGTDQLFNQWFWYGIADRPEQSIDTLGAPVIESGFGTRGVSMTYGGANAGFDIRVDYLLAGGTAGSGNSDITEAITIRNLGTSALDFRFFQYSDFDLGGTAYDQLVQMVNANAIAQRDEGTVLSETVVTPSPDDVEVGFFANTLAHLNDDEVSDLSGNGGPVGPGDLTWALNWNFILGVGDSYIISKDKNLRQVPEPFVPTAILLGIGCTLIGLLGRKAGPLA